MTSPQANSCTNARISPVVSDSDRYPGCCPTFSDLEDTTKATRIRTHTQTGTNLVNHLPIQAT